MERNSTTFGLRKRDPSEIQSIMNLECIKSQLPKNSTSETKDHMNDKDTAPAQTYLYMSLRHKFINHVNHLNNTTPSTADLRANLITQHDSINHRIQAFDLTFLRDPREYHKYCDLRSNELAYRNYWLKHGSVEHVREMVVHAKNELKKFEGLREVTIEKYWLVDDIESGVAEERHRGCSGSRNGCVVGLKTYCPAGELCRGMVEKATGELGESEDGKENGEAQAQVQQDTRLNNLGELLKALVAK